jgi:hypothetical protein
VHLDADAQRHPDDDDVGRIHFDVHDTGSDHYDHAPPS